MNLQTEHKTVWKISALAGLTFCLISQQSNATWKVSEENAESVYFYDVDSIRTQGSNKTIWTLINYKTEQKNLSGFSYQSVLSKRIFDCTNKKYEVTSYVQFERLFGNGKVIGKGRITKNQYEWTPVVSDSAVEKEWFVTCKK